MKSKLVTFLLRLISTIGLWALILGAIFSGQEWAFCAVISGMALVALFEYYGMLDGAGISHFKLTGMIAAAIFLVGSFLFFGSVGPGDGLDFELGMLVLFLFAMFVRTMFGPIGNRKPMQCMAYTLFGLLYIPWLFNFLTKILYLLPRDADGGATGQYYLLYVALVTKFSDMGAYVFGTIFGKHPFVPHISPKKTWEGIFGALFSSLLGSYWLYALLPDKLSAFGFLDLTVLGLVLGFAAVVGDLAESIVKRSTQIKDSSKVLPGIGGMLDLIDSILFTAPLLYFYMRVVMKLP